jgi:hypothetical protein
VARASVTDQEEAVEIRLTSTIACPDFTVRLRCDRDVRILRAGDRDLKRLPDGAVTLEPFTWRKDRDVIAWCADLPVGELTEKLS